MALDPTRNEVLQNGGSSRGAHGVGLALTNQKASHRVPPRLHVSGHCQPLQRVAIRTIIPHGDVQRRSFDLVHKNDGRLYIVGLLVGCRVVRVVIQETAKMIRGQGWKLASIHPEP